MLYVKANKPFAVYLLSSISSLIVDAHLIGGVALNLLLLYAIRRFSTSSIATYKYLLATFASYDVFLSLTHALTRPTVVIVDRMWGMVTDTAFGDRRITAAYVACYTVPFALMSIHFLYRFWAIRHPLRILLFTKKKFIALISTAPISILIVWFLIATKIMAGEEEEESVGRIRKEFEMRYEKTVENGWCLVNFEEQNNIRTRSVIVMTLFDIIMIGSFPIAITLASLTYYHIISAIKRNAVSSNATLNFQYKLLLAVCAQTFVPLVFVYIPYLGVNHFAFLDMPSFSIDRLCMPLTACFPAWDAVIIIVVIRDYREGLIGRLRMKKTVTIETTWRSAETTAAVTTITPIQ